MSNLQDLTAALAVAVTEAGQVGAELAARETEVASLKTAATAKDAELSKAKADLAAALAKIKELEGTPTPTPTPTPVPQPLPTGKTVFSFDVSSLGNDANVTEANKVSGHKTMFGVDNVQNIRVFFGGSGLNASSWNNARIKALTEKDSVLVSTNLRDRAGLKAFLSATPDKFRKFKGQVKICYKHEFEAEWAGAANKTAWVSDYLAANQEIADELDASPVSTQSKDDVVRIYLWYSQHIDARTKGQWKQFVGTQKFGYIGMDCYNYAVWLKNGRYATAKELLDVLIQMGKDSGLPICLPEWGGELAAGDDGTKQAQAITAQGEYMKANGVKFANWWCAEGSKDPAGNVRQHHVDNVPASKAAMTKLIRGS